MNVLKTREELIQGKTIYDMKLNVAYYARVSTDKNDQLNSLENQSKYFKEFIYENNNWSLVGAYIDEGISGTQVLNRDQFLNMINDSKKGKIDLILTKEISRFSRNVIDSIKYTEELLSNGTIVYFLSDNINTIYPDSEFRLALMSSLAQDEIRKLSERVKFGIKRKIKDKKIIGSKLTGYYIKDGKLIINDNEREIIEILFKLYSTGKYSFKKISQILSNKGYLNRYGKAYSDNTLKKMLLNPRYKGYYTANLTYVENYKTHKRRKVSEKERIIYKDKNIPVIIPPRLWNKANEIYNLKSKKRTPVIHAPLFYYIDKFGFGKKTDIDLNGEGKGIIFNLNQVGNVELATTAFGQGVSVTPIQQVTAVSAVVNGGYLYKPYIVKNISNRNTNVIIDENNKTLVRKVISSETSSIMRRALESVVAKGGGRSAYIEGYRIGGKTGTAQKVKDGKYLVGNYIMSFMAIVPSNDPQAVLYLAIDNPKNTALLSSYTTTPIARRILLDIIDALNIEKQENGMEKDLQWPDKITYEVPNVVGLDVKEAKKKLINFTIEYSGSGNKVIEQSPQPKEKLEDQGIVRLMLG